MLKFLNKQPKPLVIFVFAILTLLTMTLSGFLSAMFTAEYDAISISVALMVVAIPFHIFGKKHLIAYIISWLLNSVGVGFAAATYFVFAELTADLPKMLVAAFPAAVVLAVACLMLKTFPKSKKATLISCGVLNALLLAASAFLWANVDALFFSHCTFCLIESAVYLCVLGITADTPKKKNVLRNISFGGFGVVIIVVLVVISVITEDSAPLEILEFADTPASDKKKK